MIYECGRQSGREAQTAPATAEPGQDEHDAQLRHAGLTNLPANGAGRNQLPSIKENLK